MSSDHAVSQHLTDDQLGRDAIGRNREMDPVGFVDNKARVESDRTSRPRHFLATLGVPREGCRPGSCRATQSHHPSQTAYDVCDFGVDVIRCLLEPAVTVVAQDPAEIGATACKALFERMDGDRSPPFMHTIPTRLVTRGSGEIPPAGC